MQLSFDIELIQSEQWSSVRSRIQKILCSSVIQGSSCSTPNCTKIHYMHQFKKNDLCQYGMTCTVQGCPFGHKVSDLYDMWVDIDDLDTDEYDRLSNIEKGVHSGLFHYKDLLLIDQARRLRASSPQLSHFSDIISRFDLSETPRVSCETPVFDQVSISTPRFCFDGLIPSSMKAVDQQLDLKLYHLEQVDNESSEIEHARRGLIVEGDQLLVKTFPFVRELTIGHEQYENWVQEFLPATMIFKSYEGSLIRLWNRPGELDWRISTVRKIDAKMSRWNAGLSFADRFIESLELQTKKTFSDFCNGLNPEHIYTFWLTTDVQTKSICDQKAQHLYSLGSFDRSSEFEYNFCSFRGVPYPPRIEKPIINPADLALALSDPHNAELQNLEIQGYTILSLTGKMIKVSSDAYQKQYAIRGRKVSNKFVKYIELYGQDSRLSFHQLYPQDISRFEVLDRQMNKLIKIFNDLYHMTKRHESLPTLQPHVNKVFRKLFVNFTTQKFEFQKSMNKGIVQTKLCRKIQEDMEFGLDVLRALDKHIESMLPVPNKPEPVKIADDFHRLPLNRKQFGYKKHYSVPIPSPTLSPSTSPIPSPIINDPQSASPLEMPVKPTTIRFGSFKPIKITL